MLCALKRAKHENKVITETINFVFQAIKTLQNSYFCLKKTVKKTFYLKDSKWNQSHKVRS